MPDPVSPPRSDLSRYAFLVAAVCVGSALSHIGTSTMPFQIGALIEGSRRSATEAGLFGSAEVGALALGMILLSGWIDRVAPRWIALAGCVLALVANAGLYLVSAFPLQLAFGALAGLGYGLVFAATVAGAAATRAPDRVYAIGNAGALILIVALMEALPGVSARFGGLGVFLAIAVLPIVCAPFFLGFRSGEATVRSSVPVLRTPGAPGLLFAWAAFSTGTAALYAFSERIGISIHLRPEQVATVLSGGVFIGLIGTGAAVAASGRIRRSLALIIGVCGSGVSCLLLGYATDLVLFTAGVFTYWIFYMFLYSYLLGTAAVLDPTGRIGTLGGGLERLGYALGAAVGGLAADHLSYSSTGALGFLGCAIALAVGFPSLFAALRRRDPSGV